MSAKQAEVIVLLLKGFSQVEAVIHLGKSKSTISQLVTAARWAEVERIMKQFESLINLLKE
jgi:transposase